MGILQLQVSARARTVAGCSGERAVQRHGGSGGGQRRRGRLLRRGRGGGRHHGQLRGVRGVVPRRARAAPGAVRPAAPPRLVARRVPHHPRHLPAGALPAHGPPRRAPLGRRPARRRLPRAHAHAAPRPRPPRRPGPPRLHRERRRRRGCHLPVGAAVAVVRGVQAARGVDGGHERPRGRDEGDQGGGHVPVARRQERRRPEGQDGGGRRRQARRRISRGEDIERRGVPWRQVHHHGGRLGQQAAQVGRRRRPAGAAAAHPHLLLEGEARPRARAHHGGRLPDVRQLRRPLHLQHAVDGVPEPDQGGSPRRAAVRPGQPGLVLRRRRPGRAGGAVDRRGHARPRRHRRRAGHPAVVHVLHDPRRGLHHRLRRRGVREGRGRRRRVLRPWLQDGAGRREDPRRDGHGRRGQNGGGGRSGAPPFQDWAFRGQPEGKPHYMITCHVHGIGLFAINLSNIVFHITCIFW